MPGVRRQADGRAQGRAFPECDVRVRVQEVQRAAKTDAAAEDLDMEVSVKVKVDDGCWVPLEQVEGILPVYCELCHNLIGVRDSGLRYFKKSPKIEKIQVQIGGKSIEPILLPELDRINVVKCRICGHTQEV